jgi:HK97 family phage major capsid protein
MSLRELIEKRSRLTASMRQLIAEPKGADGDLSSEQQEQFNRMKGEGETLERQIERQQTVDDMDRRAAGTSLTATGDERLDTELRNFSLVRAIASQVPDLAQQGDYGRERELSAEVARRSGRSFQGMAIPNAVFEKRVVTTAATGSNIIGTDFRPDQFINLLYDALVIKKAGARVLNDLRGNVAIPKALTGSTATWFAENSVIPLSDMTFGQVSLTPKHVGCRTEVSRNMLLQSSPAIEDLVRADFAEILAGAVDSAAINGSGNGTVPRGILQTVGIGSVAMGTNGAALTWAATLALIGKLEDANVTGNAFLGNGKVSRMARQTLEAAGLPGWLMEEPGKLAGYPYHTTGLVPSNLTKGSGTNLSALIFGRFSDLLIGYWSEFDLLVNPYESTAYSKGNIQIRGIVTMDVAVRYPQSFAAITDIVAA